MLLAASHNIPLRLLIAGLPPALLSETRKSQELMRVFCHHLLKHRLLAPRLDVLHLAERGRERRTLDRLVLDRELRQRTASHHRQGARGVLTRSVAVVPT